MNKILNWTFGACFRTLGRFLAIFLIGILILFIGSKLDMNLPDWLALNVKAMDYGFASDWSVNLPNLQRFDFRSCNSSECSGDIAIESNTFVNGYGERTFIVNYDELDIGSNGYRIMASGGQMKKNYLYSVSYYVCSMQNLRNINTWDIYAGSYDGVTAQYSNNNLYSSNNLSNLNGTPGTGEDSKIWNTCYAFNTLLVPEQDYTWLIFSIKNTSGTLSNYYISGISVDVSELGIYTTALEETIQNSGFATAESVTEVQTAVNQVQEEVTELNNAQQETNDTIKDSDITGAEDSASGFFNDFTTETFGLTSIITAPLNSINSLINASCSPLVLPLPYINKDLTLSCMTSIYSQYFGAFFYIYQLITTGLISYYVIVRIFNLVKDFKNPEHDEIEVVDL